MTQSALLQVESDYRTLDDVVTMPKASAQGAGSQRKDYSFSLLASAMTTARPVARQGSVVTARKAYAQLIKPGDQITERLDDIPSIAANTSHLLGLIQQKQKSIEHITRAKLRRQFQ